MIQIDPQHLVSQEVMSAPDPRFVAKGNRDDFGEITTHTLIGSHGEVHVFWHNSPTPHYLYLGGYGISLPDDSAITRESGNGSLVIHGGGNHSMMQVLDAPEGLLAEDILEPRPGWLHSHSFGGKGAFPHWRSKAPVPANTPVAVYVHGSRGRKLIAPEFATQREEGTLNITVDDKAFQVKLPYDWQNSRAT